MLVRVDLGEVHRLLLAYVEKRQEPAAPPDAADAIPQREHLEAASKEPAAPAERPAMPVDEAPSAQGPPLPPAETAGSMPAAFRENTEAAMSALLADARGEGIILMGLKAHLDPCFIVSTYAEALGLTDREASRAFQAYLKKHPPKKSQ